LATSNRRSSQCFVVAVMAQPGCSCPCSEASFCAAVSVEPASLRQHSALCRWIPPDVCRWRHAHLVVLWTPGQENALMEAACLSAYHPCARRKKALARFYTLVS